jgi:hypothetical protein
VEQGKAKAELAKRVGDTSVSLLLGVGDVQEEEEDERKKADLPGGQLATCSTVSAGRPRTEAVAGRSIGTAVLPCCCLHRGIE